MSLYTLPPFLIKPLRTPLLAVAIPLAWGFVSAIPLVKVVNGPWYKALYEPPFKPSTGDQMGTLIKINRPVQFCLAGVASYLAVRSLDSSFSPATRDLAYRGLQLYWAQLGLHLAWPAFLYMKNPLLATMGSLSLVGVAGAMTVDLHEATDGATTWFLVPYCATWIFATYLNAGAWWLNRNRPALDALPVE